MIRSALAGFSLVAIATVASFGAPVAHAAPPPGEGMPADIQRAIELFDEGRRLVAAGDCAAAVPVFRESMRYNDSIGSRLNIADCHENDPLLQWHDFKGAEALARRKGDRRVDEAYTKAEALWPRLALVRIITTKPLEAAPLLDGRALENGDASESFAVAPGVHTIEIARPNGTRWSQQVTGVIGQIAIVELKEDSPPPIVPIVPVDRSQTGRTQRTVGVIVGGAGVVGLGVGTALVLVAAAKLEAAKDACGTYPQCKTVEGTMQARDANESGRSVATGADIALIAGAALLAGGAALFLTAPRGRPPTQGWSAAPSFGQTNGVTVLRSW